MTIITTIYQAVCNGYDKPKPPKSLCEHVDYTVIAGTANGDRGPLWNRSHKIVGAPLTCDLSIYMDGNINLAVPSCTIHVWAEAMLADADMAICRHADRKCAYVEVEACLGRGKITDRQAHMAHDRLVRSGLPRNFGLWECGIILRRSGVDWVEELCGRWFGEIVDSEIVRDQLWLPVTLHRFASKIPPGRFKTIEMNVRKNHLFTFGSHA